VSKPALPTPGTPIYLEVGTKRSFASALDWPGWSRSGRDENEALAALAAWVHLYDSGDWTDPPGKLALLYDLERVRELIRGAEPFHPDRDRAAFARFLIDSGCQPPPGGRPSDTQYRR